MGLKEDLQGALGVTVADAIRGMIDGKYILGYGIIEEVMADGIVMVSPSVITKKSEYIAVPCVLGTIASDALSLNIIPKEKDPKNKKEEKEDDAIFEYLKDKKCFLDELENNNDPQEEMINPQNNDE